MKVTFGEKGCRNATTDFDKLFFISTEHALHLCMALMKEERAALLAKLSESRACACVFFFFVRACVHASKLFGVCSRIVRPKGYRVCPLGFLQTRRSY